LLGHLGIQPNNGSALPSAHKQKMPLTWGLAAKQVTMNPFLMCGLLSSVSTRASHFTRRASERIPWPPGFRCTNPLSQSRSSVKIRRLLGRPEVTPGVAETCFSCGIGADGNCSLCANPVPPCFFPAQPSKISHTCKHGAPWQKVLEIATASKVKILSNLTRIKRMLLSPSL